MNNTIAILLVIWLIAGAITRNTHLKWLKDNNKESTFFVKNIGVLIVAPIFIGYSICRYIYDTHIKQKGGER